MYLKILTYKEAIESPQQQEQFLKARNYSAYYPTTANFVYNLHNKTFYEGFTIDNYRFIRHEYCMQYNGCLFDSTEPDYMLRLALNTLGFYDGKGHYGGEYSFAQLGIKGLKYSDAYAETLDVERISKLKSYDLDLIEAYIQNIIDEQEAIRCEEPDMYLQANTDRVLKKRNFFKS